MIGLVPVYVCFNSDLRLFAAMLIFYGLRMLIQTSFEMRTPPGYIWPDGLIPSLFVPAGRTTDFFYSGHVGCCLIAFLEARRARCRLLEAYCLLSIFFQTFVMLALRGHYSIDLIAGLVIAHWAHIIAKPIDLYLQSKLRRP